MDELTTITERVHLQLRALLAVCFPHVAHDEFAAAKGALHVQESLPEAIGGTIFAVSSGAAPTVAAGAARVGFALSARAFAALGAVVSSGDFIFSMLTQNPNRHALAQVQTFLEGEASAYRSWLVLIQHWLSLPRSDVTGEQSPMPSASADTGARYCPQDGNGSTRGESLGEDLAIGEGAADKLAAAGSGCASNDHESQMVESQSTHAAESTSYANREAEWRAESDTQTLRSPTHASHLDEHTDRLRSAMMEEMAAPLVRDCAVSVAASATTSDQAHALI